MAYRRGPNHATDPVICRISKQTNKLQFILTKRPDSLEWALPGGITPAGELVSKAKLSKIIEQSFGAEKTVETQKETEKFIKIFASASDSDVLYVGVSDDARNTDNSWMETIAVLVYLDDESNQLALPVCQVDHLKAAERDKFYWVEYRQDVSLFASHSKFVAAAIRKLCERNIIDENGEVITTEYKPM